MAPARWARRWLLTAVAVLAALSLSASPALAVRPGGDTGIVLSKEGSVVREDGTTMEEYEVGEVNSRRVGLGLCLHMRQHQRYVS